jgi:galactokinase
MERFAGTSASENVRRAVKTGQMAFGSGWGPDRVAIAPGRIELIGNHIDYNGGPVLAAAIDRFVAVAASTDPGNAATLRAIAADAPDEGVVALDSRELTGWRNAAGSLRTFDYARGLLAAMHERESPLSPRLPASIAIAGDVPIGLGLSSSAALCVALALSVAAGMRTDRELVLLAQEAEHRAGTPCGTMDQSASVAGGVIAFDGASLGVEQISPALGDLVFVVADSGVDRSLGASSYPARVAESREALEMARKALGVPIPHLAAVTPQQLIALDQMGVLSPHLMRRLRHIVAETGRVAEAREALAGSDWRRFGALMTASGHSSAVLYEISHPDVEDLVAEALAVDGVLGARMLGGGEGGTALILLPAETLPHLDAALRSGYYRKRGMAEREGLLTRCAFAPGATLIEESVQLDQH